MNAMTEQILTKPLDDRQELSRGFSRYQVILVALLALVQFTIIIDFMIMSPLGAIIMPALNISAAQFGVAVSAYAFSAGASGILAAGFADRFDRKIADIFLVQDEIISHIVGEIAGSYERSGARIRPG